eukprot:gb/GECH01013000.1/.p1 GENE.gb/GECH01013000.1/~~gb/GECH01013000.1/.p1  ORF type:complete len:601 (+),score=131.01 gb/GECH01013000.1/:1-1803(+)
MSDAELMEGGSDSNEYEVVYEEVEVSDDETNNDDVEVVYVDEDEESSDDNDDYEDLNFDYVTREYKKQIQETLEESKQKEYEVFTIDEVKQKQERAVNQISEVLGIRVENARILLREYKWNTEYVVNRFFEFGKEKVFKDVGLSPPQDDKDEEGEFECPGCFDDVSIQDTTTLGCGHRFCNDCWEMYIKTKVNDGQAKKILCMGYKCNKHVDETIVGKFADPKIYEKYKEKVIESFIEDNHQMSWCPSAPHCGRAIECKAPPNSIVEIVCPCKHKFCFQCLKEPHLPATCEMLKKWLKKCQDDSETFNWLNANTKDCPKCGKAIEKNGGCNHMTCSCGHHFCWLCLGGFDHKTYSHNCGRYKEDSDTENARESLQRYLHYFERYNGHMNSKRLENKTKKTMDSKIHKIYKMRPGSAWVEVQWMENAMHTLFDCRHILQYSYVFGYYMFDAAETTQFKFCRPLQKKEIRIYQNLFEDHQEQLENTTEKLSALLESPVDKLCYDDDLKSNVIGTTTLASSYMRGLLDVINNDMMQEGFYMVSYVGKTSKSKEDINSYLGRTSKQAVASSSSNTGTSDSSKNEKYDEYMSPDLQEAIQRSIFN